MAVSRHHRTPVCLPVLGMFLLGFIGMAGCSLEWPTTPTGDGELDPSSMAPRLLHRPLQDMAYSSSDPSILYDQQWIGEQGGTLQAADRLLGGIQLHVPPGALTEEILITMRGSAYGDIVVDFGPEGTVFCKPCIVALSYRAADLKGVDEERIRAWYLNKTIPAWECLGGEVDRKRKVVRFHVTHFSRYALAPRRK